jgi:hypothetical protein
LTSQLGLFDREPPERERHSFHVHGGHATVPEAQQGERKARRQEDLVLEWFRTNPYARVAPSELWTRNVCCGAPLTSVRRALSNLAKAGFLIHDRGTRRMGLYGSMEGTWRLRTEAP